MLTLNSVARNILRHYGSIVDENEAQQGLYPDISPEDWKIIQNVFPYTQTSPERLYCLIEAVRYVSRQNISGAYVECGVWKGGSSMAALFALLQMNDIQRDIHLFDTYEGMPAPTDEDIGVNGIRARDVFESHRNQNGDAWNACSLGEVQKNIALTKYPMEKIHFVKGLVEQTIPAHVPERISILRLDTDFYESTKHELIHLYPKLSSGGFLIIDDYGHWQGARKAVDEYFEKTEQKPFLFRVDYACRVGIKP